MPVSGFSCGFLVATGKVRGRQAWPWFYPPPTSHHNPATPLPNSRPNRGHQWTRDKNQKGMGMTELQERLAQEREEIAERVASFKATQEKFEREREEYAVTTLENARHGPERRRVWV
jgi:hypothetical protein